MVRRSSRLPVIESIGDPPCWETQVRTNDGAWPEASTPRTQTRLRTPLIARRPRKSLKKSLSGAAQALVAEAKALVAEARALAAREIAAAAGAAAAGWAPAGQHPLRALRA